MNTEIKREILSVYWSDFDVENCWCRLIHTLPLIENHLIKEFDEIKNINITLNFEYVNYKFKC